MAKENGSTSFMVALSRRQSLMVPSVPNPDPLMIMSVFSTGEAEVGSMEVMIGAFAETTMLSVVV